MRGQLEGTINGGRTDSMLIVVGSVLVIVLGAYFIDKQTDKERGSIRLGIEKTERNRLVEMYGETQIKTAETICRALGREDLLACVEARAKTSYESKRRRDAEAKRWDETAMARYGKHYSELSQEDQIFIGFISDVKVAVEKANPGKITEAKVAVINKQEVIEKASAFASSAHKGQLDDEGKSYYQAHLTPVVEVLRQLTTDEDIIAAGYLHDVLEDTNVTYEELRDTFSPRIAGLVLEVTHEGTKDSHGYYFPRLKSRDAILIKLADRMSNISRMGTWSAERQAQYLRKTRFWREN